jgi:hypothetical protein
MANVINYVKYPNRRIYDTELSDYVPFSNIRKRIVDVFGKSIQGKLVPIEEETNIVKTTNTLPDNFKEPSGKQDHLIYFLAYCTICFSYLFCYIYKKTHLICLITTTAILLKVS